MVNGKLNDQKRKTKIMPKKNIIDVIKTKI
jgi:hypothetical protein